MNGPYPHHPPWSNHQCQWLQCCETWCVHSLECDVPYQHAVITELMNPVTRTVVTVIPPREISTKAQFDTLAEAFMAWCKDAWRDGLQDPEIYDVIPEASGRQDN